MIFLYVFVFVQSTFHVFNLKIYLYREIFLNVEIGPNLQDSCQVFFFKKYKIRLFSCYYECLGVKHVLIIFNYSQLYHNSIS